MENQEQLPPQIDETFPSDGDLIHLYSGIEVVAREAVTKEMVVGNPILGQKDSRYGISLDVLTIGSPVHSFLTGVIDRIKEVEPSAVCVAPDDLHMTQGEVYFSERGRVVQGKRLVNAESLRKYYASMRDNLSDFDPIHLRLFRIIPTLDPQLPGNNKRSMAVVAAFLADNSPQIYNLRKDIKSSIEQEGLPTNSRLGVAKVLFVSMARLMESPRAESNTSPVLQVIDEANQNIPPNAQLTVDKIYVRSTSTISYVMPKGYVTLDPPIPLKKDQRGNQAPRFIRPSQFSPK